MSAIQVHSSTGIINEAQATSMSIGKNRERSNSLKGVHVKTILLRFGVHCGSLSEQVSWATQFIPKGKRFGPFVGEKKKRSQVTSNLYMWEDSTKSEPHSLVTEQPQILHPGDITNVYFPARGWMCVDATDPMKGNWLRYVNWACSTQEQNISPLETNRAIYYKVSRPIGPGEELLVWYSGEDNPEITAALEEERVSSLSKKNSTRAKRARGKLLERASQAGLAGFRGLKQTNPIIAEMWDGEEGPNEEDERPSSPGSSQADQQLSPMRSTDHTDMQAMSVVVMGGEEEEEEEEEVDEMEDPDELQQLPPMQTAQQLSVAESMEINEQPCLLLNCGNSGEEGPEDAQIKTESASLPGPEPEPDPDLDPDPDGELEGDPHGELYPCQHCERHFSTKQGLERHIHIHATANQQTHTFKCRYCGKSFGSQVGRRRHERRHENGPKKRPGSLGGTATIFSSVVQTDGSSPDCTTPTSHYIAIGSQFPGRPLQNSEVMKKESGPYVERPFIVDGNGESKELHLCKYCNKAFGTHTNMRRHQRRIHERHLLPKGVRRKGMLLQENNAQQQQQLPDESPSTSPPPVYLPSADTEDESDRDDYAVDISKNISENLSFYIDGKILTTSSVSSCEVIEVDSRSAALFGLDAVIISPNQISQALKVEGKTNAVKQVSNLGQPTSKRRTSTPPLIPRLKMETETGSSTTSSSSSSSSSTSSSSNLLVGGLFPQSTDSLAFQREKTVYLSPKLKQLLQTQESQKPTVALIAESHRLASPLSVTSLPGASGRFKRRTGSPPSSPQLSPQQKAESSKTEAGSSYTLKVPKLECCSMSPAGSLLSKDDGDTMSPSGKDTHSWPTSSSGGNSCNQQPLDLSSSVSRRSEGLNKVLGDSALDLSMHRKSTVSEQELKGSPAPHSLTKKRKPNTSMLEKVLMNEYAGLNPAGEDSSSALGSLACFQSLSPNTVLESAHPSPPSLTPVTMNPSSPGTSSLTSPTPPPPVLPTMPSPPGMPGSPLSQPSDCSAARPLPVLSPKMSPRAIENKPQSDTEETSLAEENGNYGDENHIPEPLDSAPHTPIKDPLDISTPPSSSEPTSSDLPTTEPHGTPSMDSSSSLLNGKLSQDLDSITDGKSQCSDPPVLSSLPESPSAPSSPVSIQHEPSPPLVSASHLHTVIKEEPDHHTDEDLSDLNPAPHDAADSSSPPPAAVENPSEGEGEDSETFCNTFVCNVCEEPFRSIKELSGHILEHAVEWPFKCEFCVQLFGDTPALLAHRTSLHGVGRIFVCSACSKEFAFLCNLQQHQKDLHPNQTCTHTTVESGKLRPQNYTDPSRAKEESSPSTPVPETSDEAAPHGVSDLAKKEPSINGKHGEDGPEDPTEELYTTIKIMASEGGKPKGPDVRLGINQHYPSFKPPPFPYHSRSHAGSVASATNFTTHNIPQTFSTAIRCTKCGNSFDNMPELHKHILACANASDKKRYTPKKNPIPLKQIVNGALSPAAASAGLNAFRRMGQPKRLNFNQEPSGKTKMSALSKKKKQLVQKAISQRNKTATAAKQAPVKVEEEVIVPEVHVCPHCSREFTYPASLSKHMAVSCPMKPVIKKGKKGIEVKKEAAAALDKSMSLRRKATDSETQQAEPESEPKPLGKTRARTSGAAEPEPPQASKSKAAAPLGRPKRPASFPAATVSPGKKSKKGQAQSLPPTLSSTSDTPSDTGQRPVMRMQRMGKEAAPKKVAEAKLSLQQSQAQPKKEERFSLRTRGRAGGPVTRSLQMANTAASVEVKTEELPAEEPQESLEAQMK